MKNQEASSGNILVTGGAGFIGTHLCRNLLERGHRVVSLDLKGTAEKPVNGVTYLQGDARDLQTLVHLFRYYGVTAVYHLAATVSVPLCQKDPSESYSHNVSATLAVLEAARLSETKVRVAFASSAALYGNLGDNQKPLSELEVSSRFSSFYAAQKHASEKMIELYTEFYGIPSLIFRFFNVYGEGQDPSSPYSGVITIFSRLAREQKPLHLHNAGIQTRDFIPVTDIANTIASSLNLPASEWDASVFNLGTGVPTTVKELAHLIRDLSKSKSEIINAPAREGDVLHSHANIDHARNRLGHHANADLARGLSVLF